MSYEANVTVSLFVRTGQINDRWQHTFRPTVTGAKGPVPGTITISQSGTDVDLSGLVNPGLAWLKNLSSDYTVSYGTYDPDTLTYRPVGKLLPGEAFPIRLAGELMSSESTGTGTGAGNATLRMKAYGGAANVFIGAYEE